MSNPDVGIDPILFNALFAKIDEQAMRRAAGLYAFPIEGNFDLNHLKKIHDRTLYQKEKTLHLCKELHQYFQNRE